MRQIVVFDYQTPKGCFTHLTIAPPALHCRVCGYVQGWERRPKSGWEVTEDHADSCPHNTERTPLYMFSSDHKADTSIYFSGAAHLGTHTEDPSYAGAPDTDAIQRLKHHDDDGTRQDPDADGTR